jgi:hypothetical protein
MDPASPIDPADFRSVELKAVLRPRDPRGRERAPVAVRICELREPGFLLEVPSGLLQKGQEAALEIFREAGDEFPLLQGAVRVDSVEREETLSYNENDVSLQKAAVDSVEARLTAFRPEDWDSLVSIFSVRQQEIEEFLRAARGY